MEVKLDKRYPLDVSVAQAWTVLSDIRATAGCMQGAAITEQIDDTHFKGTVKSKVGPAVMSFGGDIEVLDINPADKRLQMLGKGADKSGSSASMNLTAHLEAGDTAASSVLVGQATIIVSGKLAQFGSRLLVPVSDAMLAQFAVNFRNVAAAVPVAVAVDAAAPEAETDTSAAPAAAPAMTSAAGPASPPQAQELNALALIWTVIKGWFAGLFSKKS